MSEIKLEAGKTYITREGQMVKIAKEHDSWRFIGDNGRVYWTDGTCGVVTTPFDIVAEVAISDANQKHNK